jgi:hypothetical protein
MCSGVVDWVRWTRKDIMQSTKSLTGSFVGDSGSRRTLSTREEKTNSGASADPSLSRERKGGFG